MIPYLDISLEQEIENECLDKVRGILHKGNFILGDEVSGFEQNIADYLGVRYVLGVNSGFSSIYLALLAMGIGSGDRVITVANTFVGTVSPIELTGAQTIFADVGPDRNMDVSNLEKLITPSTKAIIPVHLAGIPANMNALCQIAHKHGIHVIEDASQAFGSRFCSKYVGTFSDVGCFSMHPTKCLGACGDAGMIVTDNPDIYEKIKLLRNHGLSDRDHCNLWGFNSRLDELQAGLLNVKLKYINRWNQRRRQIADMYFRELADTDFVLPYLKPGDDPVYFSYVIQSRKRDKLKNYLWEHGVEAKIHYPVHVAQQKACIEKYGEICNLPVTEKQNDRILSLPIYPALTDEQILYICRVLHDFDEADEVDRP